MLSTTSRPPGRNSQPPPDQRRGSHETSPYSEISRSNRRSASGGRSTFDCSSGNGRPCSRCSSGRSAAAGRPGPPDRPGPGGPARPTRTRCRSRAPHVQAGHVVGSSLSPTRGRSSHPRPAPARPPLPAVRDLVAVGARPGGPSQTRRFRPDSRRSLGSCHSRHHARPARRSTSRSTGRSAGAEAGAAVEELAGGVEVAGVAGGLLDHVQDDPAQVGGLGAERVGVPGRAAPSTAACRRGWRRSARLRR